MVGYSGALVSLVVALLITVFALKSYRLVDLIPTSGGLAYPHGFDPG